MYIKIDASLKMTTYIMFTKRKNMSCDNGCREGQTGQELNEKLTNSYEVYPGIKIGRNRKKKLKFSVIFQ